MPHDTLKSKLFLLPVCLGSHLKY